MPTLAQLLKQAIENRLLDVHTAIMGRIQKYDAKTQTADIEALSAERLPLLIDIPILFPSAGGFFISFPIKPGDLVQVIFNETSANSNQRFSLQEAVAIPRLYPIKDAHKNNLVLGKDEGVQIHIDGDKIRLGSERADEALAIASKVKNEFEKFKEKFNSHTHTGSCPSGAVTTIATSNQIGLIPDLATQKVVGE